MNLHQQLSEPIRHPDTASPHFMSKRGRWLILLGFILPGSAQVLTGNRKLGRIGLTATLLLLAGGLAALVGMLVNSEATLSILTNIWVLLAVQIALFVYALIWLILGFDTLRLTRLGRVAANWRAPLAALSIILTIVPVLGAAWAGTQMGAGRELISTLFVDRAAVEPVNGRYNILLLGADSGADREGLRPDSISLVSVDAKTGQSLIIGLPREMAYAPFPETSPMFEDHPHGFGVTQGCNVGRCWLNGLYSEGEYFVPELYPNALDAGSSPGIEATKDAVSGITGLTVQFYVLINMEGFEELINALGGVDINVTEQIPIGGDADGNGVEGWLEPGQQHLDGYHALWYARSRYGSAAGDYSRMERQRELQAAILQQMTPSNVIARFQDIAASGSALAQTDIPQSMVGRFIDLAAKAKEYEPVRLELSPPEVVTEDPDYDRVLELVEAALAEATSAKE